MKAKITMTISIACIALILTMVIFTQFKTVDETDITAIETMRETELRTELASWKSKYEEIETTISERESKIQEYEQELVKDETASTVLESEVKEAEAYLGYTSLTGQGITVTLQDNENRIIEYEDILRLVNELNNAGAEAISINDERIISMSEITLVNGRIIIVNAKRVAGPYTIKAIGDKTYFESALNIKGGFIDEMQAAEKTISYVTEDNVVIPAYDDTEKRDFKYAKEYIEEKE